MFQIIIKKIIFITVLLFIISCNNANSLTINVRDSLWKMESTRSARISNNKTDNFCLIYEEFLVKRNDIYDKKELGFIIANFLKSKNIKINTNYLITSLEKAKVGRQENNNFLDDLKKQETENNYKNCDYLIFYSIWHGEEEYYTDVAIDIFDIRKNATSSSYGLDGTDNSFFNKTYPKLEEFIDEALEKWWKKTQE
jgi:hypothetical protein